MYYMIETSELSELEKIYIQEDESDLPYYIFANNSILYISCYEIIQNIDKTCNSEILTILINSRRKVEEIRNIRSLLIASGKENDLVIRPYIKIYTALSKIDPCVHIIAYNDFDNKNKIININIPKIVDDFIITSVYRETELKTVNNDINIFGSDQLNSGSKYYIFDNLKISTFSNDVKTLIKEIIYNSTNYISTRDIITRMISYIHIYKFNRVSNRTVYMALTLISLIKKKEGKGFNYEINKLDIRDKDNNPVNLNVEFKLLSSKDTIDDVKELMISSGEKEKADKISKGNNKYYSKQTIIAYIPNTKSNYFNVTRCEDKLEIDKNIKDIVIKVPEHVYHINGLSLVVDMLLKKGLNVEVILPDTYIDNVLGYG